MARKGRGRCAIYARFSSERQREESIEDQVRVCREWSSREHGRTLYVLPGGLLLRAMMAA